MTKKYDYTCPVCNNTATICRDATAEWNPETQAFYLVPDTMGRWWCNSCGDIGRAVRVPYVENNEDPSTR